MTSLTTGTSGIPYGWTVIDDLDYLTLTALSDGEITITIPSDLSSSCATYLSYSKDKSVWEKTDIDYRNHTITIPVSSGDKVYLKGKAKQWYEGGEGGASIDSSANINVSGNIMSLLYEDNFEDKTVFPDNSEYTFSFLFNNNKHLCSAEKLILPATVLATCCYRFMFSGCTSLTTAPELPATTLAYYCYAYMFYSCYSLEVAPKLPATVLAESCYYEMFAYCDSLTTAPELPATKLYNDCYDSMFQRCTSLTTAPELPATTLAYSCYYSMFYGCEKLNSITMLATDISASGCLSNWVNGVAPKGTFVKAHSMTSLPSGESGIPTGWTVVNK